MTTKCFSAECAQRRVKIKRLLRSIIKAYECEDLAVLSNYIEWAREVLKEEAKT